MKPIRHAGVVVATIALAFCALCETSIASPITKHPVDEDANGSVVARLLASFSAHAEPASRWYLDLLHGQEVGAARFARFMRHFDTATFGSFTYTYTVNGEQHSRVYHARSGPNEPPTGFADRQPVRPYRQYFTGNQPEIVVWNEPPPTNSSVTSSPVAGDTLPDARRADAELKVARRIENDIRQGVVPSGGRLHGFTTQAPCPSCERALQELSDTQSIGIDVTYLARQGPAYRSFHGQRHTYLLSIRLISNGGAIRALETGDGIPFHTVSSTTPGACALPECEDSNEFEPLDPIEVPYNM